MRSGAYDGNARERQGRIGAAGARNFTVGDELVEALFFFNLGCED
ncbi:hypothetical protein SFOMI_2385 [Sphingobium fuliginis]|uniref:Uncharacterized protein n=1 Tax=Sphingobium fuliginis (strain ATCC 27551) TaxID=336203 RepID=A0A292ZAS3_SPHSA|nr:hypothetical protein SFOMI_2385 [Sphingobium fuliginis]